MVLPPFTKKSKDLSDQNGFQFSFYCDRCGRAWTSQRIPYQVSADAASSMDDLHKAVWAYQHNAAYERANNEGMLLFSHCPTCERWVCDSCIDIGEQDCADYCKDCMAHQIQAQKEQK